MEKTIRYFTDEEKMQLAMNIMVKPKGEVNMKYYKRESGTIVKMDDDMQVFYLDANKNWVNDQSLVDMFIDDLDYEEIDAGFELSILV